MIIRETTNRAEVLAYKKHRDFVINKNAVGLIPIPNRPKPIYIFREITTEQYNIEAFERHCDKLEASNG